MGKVMIIKTLGYSKLQFLASAIAVPDEICDKIEKLTTRFLWNGRPKVARKIIAKDFKDGGLKLPMVMDIVAGATLQWIKRAYYNSEKIWAKNIIHELNEAGGLKMFNYTLNKTEIRKLQLTNFTKHIIEAGWKITKENEKFELDEDAPLWHNKKIVAKRLRARNETTIKPERLAKLGINFLKDLFDETGKTITGAKAIELQLPANAICEWNKITKIIKPVTKSTTIIGTSRNTLNSLTENNAPHCEPEIIIRDIKLTARNMTQGKIVKTICDTRKVDQRNYQKQMSAKHNISEEDWQKINTYVKKHSNYPKTREFIFKLNNKILGTNIDFVGVGYKPNAQCTYCPEPRQTFDHLFLNCPSVNSFKDAVTSKILGFVKLEEKDWLFGAITNNTREEKAINYIMKETLKFIYRENWAHEQLSIGKFAAMIKYEQKLEGEIARNNNKTITHLKKWEKINEFIN